MDNTELLLMRQGFADVGERLRQVEVETAMFAGRS